MPVFLDTQHSSSTRLADRIPNAKLASHCCGGSATVRGAIVNAEVVQEVMFVLVRRGRLRNGLRLARDVLALFPGLFLVTRQDMLRACGLLERYPRLPVRGAIHVATMLNNGLQTVVSVDADFDQVVEIRRVAPGSA